MSSGCLDLKNTEQHTCPCILIGQYTQYILQKHFLSKLQDAFLCSWLHFSSIPPDYPWLIFKFVFIEFHKIFVRPSISGLILSNALEKYIYCVQSKIFRYTA